VRTNEPIGEDRRPGARLGRSRSHVLEALESAGGAVAVADLAAQVHLHPNTTRFHLDALVDGGLAERHDEDRGTPGRPRALYTASPDSAGLGRRSYQLLAQILAGHLAAHSRSPALAAQDAGRAWGRFLARRPAPFTRIDADAATGRLVDLLADIGFMPEAVTTSRRRRIDLHHCPFREIATTHGEVVCSVHLGLMQGLLTEIDAPIQAQRVEPFAEPMVCRVDLEEHPDHGSSRTGLARQASRRRELRPPG
jgi:predicted ArsR family transcriptional regulator